jgi:hypothetical protein
VGAREKIGWDDVAIIFKNDFRDYASNLFLADNSLWLLGFERVGFG